MTNITIENDNNKYSIRAVGHATGSEKVCSGISALLYGLAGWLASNPVSACYTKLEPGDAVIGFESVSPEAKAAFDVTAIGLLQIEKSYPDFVKIKKI